MAATGLKIVTGLYADIKSASVFGEGAIEATDALVTNIVKYPLGSMYFDTTNRIHYVRKAVAAAIGDWCKSSAYSSAAVVAFTAPLDATSWVQGETVAITWTDNVSENVDILLYKGASKVLDIVLDTLSDGTYSWLIPATLTAGSDYTMRIKSHTSGDVLATSEIFDIVAAAITITAPTGITSWVRGATQNITWTDNITEAVDIALYKNAVKVSDIVLATASDGSYAWTLANDLVAGADYTVKITGAVNTLVTKTSAAFTVTET
jgi:hypothetical protein